MPNHFTKFSPGSSSLQLLFIQLECFRDQTRSPPSKVPKKQEALAVFWLDTMPATANWIKSLFLSGLTELPQRLCLKI